jgi:hypothetical protein
MEKRLTYTEASKMTKKELLDVNTALDIYIEKVNKGGGK